MENEVNARTVVRKKFCHYKHLKKKLEGKGREKYIEETNGETKGSR